MIDLFAIHPLPNTQRGLLPPGPDRSPLDSDAVDRPSTPCAFQWSGNEDRYGNNDESYFVRACEFDSVEAATAYFNQLAQVSAANAAGSTYPLQEAINHGGWVGDHTGNLDEEWDYVRIERQDGLRVYQAVARTSKGAEATLAAMYGLADLQDQWLVDHNIAPDLAGAGYADQAQRLSLDGVLLRWDTLAELGGEPITDTHTSYDAEFPYPLWGPTYLPWGERTATFANGEIDTWVRRETSPALAALTSEWGTAVPGVETGRMYPDETPGTGAGTIVFGDRVYTVTVSGTLAGNGDGKLLERTIQALDQYLRSLDLAAPVGDPNAAFAALGSEPLSQQILDQIVPPSGTTISWVMVDSDPITGRRFVRVKLDQTEDSAYQGNDDFTILTDVDAATFSGLALIERPAIDGSVNGWQELIVSQDALVPGEPLIPSNAIYVQMVGDIGVAYRPPGFWFSREEVTGRQADYQAQLDMGLAIVGLVAQAPADPEGDHLSRRVQSLLGPGILIQTEENSDGQSIFSFGIPNGELGDQQVVAGGLRPESPLGAVAEWLLAIDVPEGGAPETAQYTMQVVGFGDAAQASAYVNGVLGPDPEPVDGIGQGGLTAIDGGAVIAMANGRFAFVMTNRASGVDVSAKPVADPVETLRRLAPAWVSSITDTDLR